MWGITAGLFAILITMWFLWRRKRFMIFKENGIPGPEPSIIFGNYRELAEKNPVAVMQEWEAKYGKVYGYFYGASPVLVVNDVELLKKIQVSDFHKYINRARIFEVGRKEKQPGDGFNSQLVNLKDKKWKEIRSAITPAFTANKMRMMSPIIYDAIDALMDNIDKRAEANESFDIYEYYQGLTMDVIGRTAFGIQTDCQKNSNDIFIKACKWFFDADVKYSLFVFGFSFPELAYLFELYLTALVLVYNYGSNPIRQMVNAVKDVIKTRKDVTSNRRQDLLQYLVDAKVTLSELNAASVQNLAAGHDRASAKEDEDIKNDTGLKAPTSFRSLTEGEIVDTSVLFFLAGYETTSTTLAFATHFLVHFPEVQERVRDEVNELLRKEGKLDYTSVQQLQYLDQVFNESMRFYPPIYLFVIRETSEDVELASYNVKKGIAIQVPVYNLHHDKDIWPDPEKFDPDRFSPENKRLRDPIAFQAFGAGPRNCVGMRFAQMEFKMAIARILHKYRLNKCDETGQHPIHLKYNIITLTPAKGIFIKAEPLR